MADKRPDIRLVQPHEVAGALDMVRHATFILQELDDVLCTTRRRVELIRNDWDGEDVLQLERNANAMWEEGFYKAIRLLGGHS